MKSIMSLINADAVGIIFSNDSKTKNIWKGIVSLYYMVFLRSWLVGIIKMTYVR